MTGKNNDRPTGINVTACSAGLVVLLLIFVVNYIGTSLLLPNSPVESKLIISGLSGLLCVALILTALD